MKSKLFVTAQAIVLVVAVVIAGATTGKVLPGIAVPRALGSSAPVNAAGLTVQPRAPLAPVGTGFTYQGSLKSGGNPASGNYDFAFTLYDALTGGNQVSTPITLTNQTVSAGLFTVSLDFGTNAFDGNGRWVELAVRQSGGGGYTTLSPRQPITPAPYALFALKTTPYKNVVVVAQSGGQFTSISAALSSITDNSSANRYLIYVAPGTYSERVTMKPYVDIEGSGEHTTIITFTGSPSDNTGTVVGATNAELRSLYVVNTGGNAYAVAIYNNGASPRLRHVSALAAGATTTNYGVLNSSASPTMIDLTAIASGGATYNLAVYNVGANSGPYMSNVTANAGAGTYNYGVQNLDASAAIEGSNISANGGTGSYGIYNIGAAQVTVDNSKVTASTNTIYNSTGTTTRVGASQLSGGPVADAGTLTCTASYDDNKKRLGADCTRMTKVATVGLTDGDYNSIQGALNDVATWCGTPSATNKCLVRVLPGTYTERVTMVQYVDIEGAGENATKITFAGSGAVNTGTVVGASNAELRFVSVENTGGNAYAIAVYNSGVSPSLLHVAVLAFGASSVSYGMFNVSSSPTMTNVAATVSGGSSNIGVANNSSSPKVVASIIDASGAITNYGVYSVVSGLVTIDSSKITGSTNTIYNTGATIRIGASQLSGGAVSGAGVSCSASYDENYVSPGLNVCP